MGKTLMTVNELVFDLISREIDRQEVWSTHHPEDSDVIYIEGYVNARAIADLITENVIADPADRVPAIKENQ